MLTVAHGASGIADVSWVNAVLPKQRHGPTVWVSLDKHLPIFVTVIVINSPECECYTSETC